MPMDSIRRDSLLGVSLIVLLVGGGGGWAATTSLAGAVVGAGMVVVDTAVKKVQHPTGGVISEIRVKDGDSVQAGDVVLKLDETVARANLGVITKQLDELAMRRVRLAAERDGAGKLETPTEFEGRGEDADIREIIAGEQNLFETRRRTRDGQKGQLRERIQQLREEIVGLTQQAASKKEETALIAKELKDLATLETSKLVPASKMTQLRREAARISGEHAQVVSGVAQARGKITEIELQVLQIDQDMRTEVVKEMRELQGKVAELNERRAAAHDQLARVDVRAPQSGIVHQMLVHTVGGVASPAEPLMLVVPEGDALVIEAKVAPQDIDHVRLGQSAFIRFPAFNQRTTPEFSGKVTRVSADVRKDDERNVASQLVPFYVVRVSLVGEELAKAASLQLMPGMPAEVHFRTAERTALSYLLKPLRDQVARAFNEI